MLPLHFACGGFGSSAWTTTGLGSNWSWTSAGTHPYNSSSNPPWKSSLATETWLSSGKTSGMEQTLRALSCQPFTTLFAREQDIAELWRKLYRIDNGSRTSPGSSWCQRFINMCSYGERCKRPCCSQLHRTSLPSDGRRRPPTQCDPRTRTSLRDPLASLQPSRFGGLGHC